MSYLNCKQIDTAIRRAKKKLTEEARINGLYENFGQREVGEIRERFIDSTVYTQEMNLNRSKLKRFDDWCSTFSLRDL